jgi:hypothetical protein
MIVLEGRLLFPFKELNLFFVFLCGFARIECAEVPALPRLRIFLFRIQAVPA